MVATASTPTLTPNARSSTDATFIGNMTSYLCVNSIVFNQVTLICDAWYNVDCANSAQCETYANSRLYTDLPLFDTPPADYLTPAQRAAQQAAEVQAAGG
ncbi:hypothetical protein RvY_06825 [Ramazzottius varieornatus]|uniref:Chitin-binding type-2 domain-containing protein n=1 Tax=Ramazzottius varieornatus TaxID=947166 RepID=A0A1D1V2S0_RAMVA|nr:hypothetical protein RvY_06825 [Ramazzottius varieornatus]